MADQYTRGDSLREYLTGAASDSTFQDDPALSLGGFASLTDAASLGMQINNPIKGVQLQFASPTNPTGPNSLIAVDQQTLQWQPNNSLIPGMPVEFPPGVSTVKIIEGPSPGQFIRVLGTPPFSQAVSRIDLDISLNSVFGMNIVSNAVATAGASQYRATILKNKSQGAVAVFARWIKELATSVLSNAGQLGGSGSGVLRSSSSFSDWPTSGYCRIEISSISNREVVYYSSRTDHTLIVPAAGRGLLGTSAGAGSAADTLRSVPGIAIALDNAGIQSNGSAIQTIANETTAPTGVTWRLGSNSAAGLYISQILPGQQLGFWIWRQIPAGAVYLPNVYNPVRTYFTAY